MHLVNVNCSNCGELLSIPESVKLATCNGCKMPLTINQTDSVTFTEPMLLVRPEELDIEPYEEKDMMESSKLSVLEGETKPMETAFLGNEKIMDILGFSNPVAEVSEDDNNREIIPKEFNTVDDEQIILISIFIMLIVAFFIMIF